MRGQPAPPLESADLIRKILLKLPTRDVTRCRTVSRLWRGVVVDPTFRRLHAENVSAAPEALLVTETREHGRSDEASFSCVSSSKPTPMPRRVVIPSGYSLSNVCNGLLCFALDSVSDAPAFVCNPVTGETATLPKAPSLHLWGEPTVYHHFALGFSPSTKEHKLFRFSSLPPDRTRGNQIEIHQSVCTLEGGGRWRERSYISTCPLLRTSPPVLVDGKLYLVAHGGTSPELQWRWNPGRVLVVDVATEEHHMHRFPVEDNEYFPAFDPLVNTFEMSGRLCLALHMEGPRSKLQFWVMSLPPENQWAEYDDNKLCWSLSYSFYTDDDRWVTSTGTWFDDDENTLCSRRGDVLFKHGTRGRSPEPSPDADCPPCDQHLELPPTPPNCKWNVFSGYRPSLLSPLTLATSPSPSYAESTRQHFEPKLLLTLRHKE